MPIAIANHTAFYVSAGRYTSVREDVSALREAPLGGALREAILKTLRPGLIIRYLSLHNIDIDIAVAENTSRFRPHHWDRRSQ